VLGIDPGGKRLGLALGDTRSGVVRALETVFFDRRAVAVDRIVGVIAEHGIDVVVVGLPTDADGNETGACRRSYLLADELKEHDIDVRFQPEYLSSDEARRRAQTLGRPASRPVDDLAAQVIVEDFLAAVNARGGLG
jgi:putative Holliday junction resolvase